MPVEYGQLMDDTIPMPDSARSNARALGTRSEGPGALSASAPDIYRRKASGSCPVDGGNDFRNLFLDYAPIVRAQNKHRDFSACQILLVAEFLIRCNEQVEPSVFSRNQ
jgi:hypothetical protein